MPRVGTDLDGAVVQFNVGIRNTVILVDPVGVQGQIRIERVLIPNVLLCALRIVIPAVKDGIKTLGLGHILQGVGANENLLGVIQLVGHHVEGDRTAFLQHESTHVQSTVAKVPVGAKVTQIVAGGVDQFFHRIKFGILILRHIQRQHTCRDGGCKGRTVHAAVSTAHFGGIHHTGGDKIHVFAIVGVGG